MTKPDHPIAIGVSLILFEGREEVLFYEITSLDKGIDGRLCFLDEGMSGNTKQVVLSVKAGKPAVSHLRDLRGVLDREGAEIGVLIAMREPTQPMRAEAAGAGHYESPWGTSHPRLQILTVEELLGGKRIDMPPIRQTSTTFKKAKRHEGPETRAPGLRFGDEMVDK